MREAARVLVALILIASCCWNIRFFKQVTVTSLPSRQDNDIVVLRERLNSVQEVLKTNRYLTGKIGFVTATELRNEPLPPDDDKNFWQAQYLMYPFILVRGSLDSPFVLVDSEGGESVPPLPGDLVLIQKNSNGFLLFQKAHSQ